MWLQMKHFYGIHRNVNIRRHSTTSKPYIFAISKKASKEKLFGIRFVSLSELHLHQNEQDNEIQERSQTLSKDFRFCCIFIQRKDKLQSRSINTDVFFLKI